MRRARRRATGRRPAPRPRPAAARRRWSGSRRCASPGRWCPTPWSAATGGAGRTPAGCGSGARAARFGATCCRGCLIWSYADVRFRMMVPVSRLTSTRCAFDNARSNTVRNALVSTTCPTIVARNGSATWRLVPARCESWRTSTLASSACTSSWSSNRFAVSVNLDVWRKFRSSHHPVLAVTSPIPPMTSRIVAPISRSLRRSLTLCSFVRYSPITPVYGHTGPLAITVRSATG